MFLVTGLLGAMLAGMAIVGLVASGDTDADEDDPADPIDDGPGGAHPVRLTGTAGDDILAGSDANDQISGLAGDDQINGYDGDDLVQGGAGADDLYGGSGADTVLGEAGDDALHGEAGQDLLRGGAGQDSLYGYSGADTLAGGGDDDSLVGGDGRDILSGDAGADALHGGLDDDSLSGGAGEDTLFGGWGNDLLTGRDDMVRDYLNGGGGDDTITAGSGDLADLGEGMDELRLGDWILDPVQVVDFDASDDTLLVIYDDSISTDPELQLRPSDRNPSEVVLWMDDCALATFPEGDLVEVSHITLLPQSGLGNGLTA